MNKNELKDEALRDAKKLALMLKIKGDEDLEVTHAKILCYNRNRKGECLAYKKPECCENCPARITDINKKIELLESLQKYSHSRVDSKDIEAEVREAIKVRDAQRAGRFDDWMSCYYEDRHRGSGGGSSESDSNRSTGMKTLLKDNRGLDTKPTKADQAKYKEALDKWEEENGKLPRLARSSMSHSKEDSYLEEDK